MDEKKSPLNTWTPAQRSTAPPPQVVVVPTTPATLGVAPVTPPIADRSAAAHKAWATRRRNSRVGSGE